MRMLIKKDPISHRDWVDAAPDSRSWLAALKVQDMWLAADCEVRDHVRYIMDVYGDTREHAETIVKNCRKIEE
jgi:hypothetical protein